MHVYFARHGKTKGNTERFIPSHTEPLNEIGTAEATRLTQRLASVPLEHIFSSEFARAKETALTVAKNGGLEHTVLPELNELIRGEILEGRHYADKETKRLLDVWWESLDTPHHKKYTKETEQESYLEFKLRAERALEFLAHQSYKNIGVVTHSGTLRMLLGLIVFREQLTPGLFRSLFFNLDMNTTGISVAEYTKERGWRMLVWNDCSHLADPINL